MSVERPRRRLDEGNLGESNGVSVLDAYWETTRSVGSAWGHQVLHGTIPPKCALRIVIRPFTIQGL